MTFTARLRGALVRVAGVAALLFVAACDPDALAVDERSAGVDDPVDALRVADPGADEVAPEVEVIGEFTSEDDAAEGPKVTVCYCGVYNGSPLYVGVECAGYPSPAVCCSDKCSQLIGLLSGQG